MPIRLTKTDTSLIQDKNYITHADQEVEGLKFNTVLIDGKIKYTIVMGEEPNIEKWIARVGAITTTALEINTKGKQMAEVQRICLNCGQLYTPAWKPI